MWPQPNRKFALAGVALVLLTGSSFARVNIPDWMHHLAAVPLGTYPAETKAVVLLDQTDYTVIGPGEYVEHSRWVVKILRPDGRSAGNLGMELRKDDKLNDIHAWTLDSTGHEYELKKKDFEERGFSSFELYSDFYILAATAPAADPGSIIAFEYEVQRHAYANQLNQFIQETNPVREARISLTLPPEWNFKDAWPAASGVAPVQTSANHWEWIEHDLPGIQKEPHMPPAVTVLTRLAIAYFPPGNGPSAFSWQSLGNWYWQLSLGRRDPDPEVRKQVQALISGKPDFDAKLQAITRFIQSQIRYVAIEIGVGGYQPHPADEIFRDRYGDCKDKATLLSAMLKVAGINSDYVLIDTDRGFVNPAVPSIWFDHAILAIEIPASVNIESYKSVITMPDGKRYIIFDPTDEYTPVGLLSSDLQDSDALLVTSSGGGLIHTPLLAPDSNDIARKAEFILTADGNLSGEVSEDRSGDFAMQERYRMHNSDERERKNYLDRWLGRFLQGFSLDDLKIQQVNQIQKDVLTSYKLSVPQYGQVRGPLMLVRLCVLDEKGQFVEHKVRHYPVELESLTHQTDSYEIEIPKEYAVDELPEPVKIDLGFASYQSQIHVEGQKLIYRREYTIRNLSVPPDKFAQWAQLQGIIGADENAAAVLKRLQ